MGVIENYRAAWLAGFDREMARKDAPMTAPLGWIAVTERLPRMGERVMVAHAADKWIGVGERDIIGSYEYWSDDGEELNQPTHWMPLPEPPEVK